MGTNNKAGATRAGLLTACTTLKEIKQGIPDVGLVVLRELTAQQRMDISQAASAGGPFNTALANALTMQTSTYDSEGRDRLLTPEDIPALIDGRAGLVGKISDRIWALSEASLDSLKSGDRSPDTGE